MCLNQRNYLNGFKHVSTGSLTASLVHPREVFIAALELHAAALIFVHNHPSGIPTPSPEDIDLTRRLREVGEVMGIRIIDHVILGDSSFFSMNDRGLMEGAPMLAAKQEETRKRTVGESVPNQEFDDKSLWTPMRRKFEKASPARRPEILRAWKKRILQNLTDILKRIRDPQALDLLASQAKIMRRFCQK